MVKRLMSNTRQCEEMSLTMSKFCDGLGSKRVVKVLMKGVA